MVTYVDLAWSGQKLVQHGPHNMALIRAKTEDFLRKKLAHHLAVAEWEQDRQDRIKAAASDPRLNSSAAERPSDNHDLQWCVGRETMPDGSFKSRGYCGWIEHVPRPAEPKYGIEQEYALLTALCDRVCASGTGSDRMPRIMDFDCPSTLRSVGRRKRAMMRGLWFVFSDFIGRPRRRGRFEVALDAVERDLGRDREKQQTNGIDSLTASERIVWDALDGRAMQSPELATWPGLNTDPQVVREHVKNIRRKLEKESIATHRHFGYYRPEAPPDWDKLRPKRRRQVRP